MKSVVHAEKSATSKKTYQTPRLVTHGDVAKLTLHGETGCFSGIGDKYKKHDCY
ncbi:MAG TPA: lasso RiPP family leader peptide-containing protein [Tepidisphaeraceae bacterium]|nr:lasso RiPP family leader peptide-containing protein [Tepidisphaeraceae bacterium]